jgi:N-acetylglucosamine malate deacetylase 1
LCFITVGTTRDYSNKGVSTQKERYQELRKVSEYLKYDAYSIAFPGEKYHLKLDALPQEKLINEIELGNKLSLQNLRPDIVFIPLIGDYNQDHRAVAQAAITAMRPKHHSYKHFQPIVLAYELPTGGWCCNEDLPHLSFIVNLSLKDIRAKKTAMSFYNSQLKDHRGPLSLHSITALAQIRGLQAGVHYGEAFYVKRILI